MRILLDECVDQGLRQLFANFDCQTARYAGFARLENGELLNAAGAADFDVLLTVDRGFEYEQDFTGRKIAIVIFRAGSNRLSDLLSHIPECIALLASLKPGQVVKIPGNQN